MPTGPDPIADAPCGHDPSQDGLWPLADGTEGCYPCFEAEADREWWEAVAALPADPNDLLTTEQHADLNAGLACLGDQRRRVEAEGRCLPMA